MKNNDKPTWWTGEPPKGQATPEQRDELAHLLPETRFGILTRDQAQNIIDAANELRQMVNRHGAAGVDS